MNSASATGWAGRVADTVLGSNTEGSLTGVSLSGNQIFLVGNEARPALINPGPLSGLAGINNTRGAQARLQSVEELLAMDQGSRLGGAYARTAREGIRVPSLLSSLLDSRPFSTAFPATSLGRQLEQVARLIKVRNELGITRQVFFCSLGGFDTHINQLASHDALMTQLSGALGAFYQATQELGVGDNVTTFTESEFGRTLQQSSGAGSDHGWGGHHFIMGGSVKGGDIYGTYPTIAIDGPDDATGRGVWVPTTSLDQYGATLASWFGLAPELVGKVFPSLGNFSTANLGFLG